jgi:hypothetical protein
MAYWNYARQPENIATTSCCQSHYFLITAVRGYPSHVGWPVPDGMTASRSGSSVHNGLVNCNLTVGRCGPSVRNGHNARSARLSKSGNMWLNYVAPPWRKPPIHHSHLRVPLPYLEATLRMADRPRRRPRPRPNPRRDQATLDPHDQHPPPTRLPHDRPPALWAQSSTRALSPRNQARYPPRRGTPARQLA